MNSIYRVYHEFSLQNGLQSLLNQFTKWFIIIINRKRGWFNYKGFIEFANLSITKQGALKVLNNFLKMNLLITKTNSKKEKIFSFNDEYLFYEMN